MLLHIHFVIFIMALRRYHFKKLTTEEILAFVEKETNFDNIKLASTILRERNDALKQKKTNLMSELERVRTSIRNGVKNINGRVKDRLDKEEKIVLDRDSRPTPEEMNNILTVYSFMENQNKIIEENYRKIQEINTFLENSKKQLLNKGSISQSLDHLDEKYEKLNKECVIEEEKLRKQIQRKEALREHYKMISRSIEGFRKQYEEVQQSIRQKERQYIQITTYFETRVREDRQRLIALPQEAIQLEKTLLEAQGRLNQLEGLRIEREIGSLQKVI